MFHHGFTLWAALSPRMGGPRTEEVLNKENLGGANVELTTDDLRELDSAASKINVQGERYLESAQRMINR